MGADGPRGLSTGGATAASIVARDYNATHLDDRRLQWSHVSGALTVCVARRTWTSEQVTARAFEIEQARRFGRASRAPAAQHCHVRRHRDMSLRIVTLLGLTLIAAVPPTTQVQRPTACVLDCTDSARLRIDEHLSKSLSEAGSSPRPRLSVYQRVFSGMVLLLGQAVAKEAPSCADPLVGYSLGALVVRAYLENAPPVQLGRVVMIAPPNHGSRISIRSGIPGSQILMGPWPLSSGQERKSLPTAFDPHATRSVSSLLRPINPLGWLLIPG